MPNNNDFDKWLNGINNSDENQNNEYNNQNNNKEDYINVNENQTRYEFDNNRFEDTFNNENFKEDSNYKDINFEKRENAYSQFANKEYVDQQIRKSRPRFTFLKALALVLVGSVLGAFVSPFAYNLIGTKGNNKEINSNYPNQSVTINTDGQQNVENAVAQKSIPSVVGVKVLMIGQDDWTGRATQGEGIGSGVIVSEDGYILTNAHVVGNNPKEISVLFSDNETSAARVVWKDASLDLAVIKVERTGLQAVEFADSDKIQIGDKAIAIGNPFGLNLQSTLTSGYISGLNRDITMQNGQVMSGLIQTDASINQGNSGGALLNSKGELIGINTARANNSDGIGFAIPSNLAKSIVDRLSNGGEYNEVVLGVRGTDLINYKRIYSDNTIDINTGVIITEVVEDSSALEAGMRQRDVITKIEGVEIESMNKFKQELLKYKVGDKVKITVYRDGKEIDLDVVFKGATPNL